MPRVPSQSSVAWMSFDEDQQRRTMLLMQALSESGTLDQLGFGLVRDLLSSHLTPGVTSLMTRARYLLFVPWVYQELQGASATTLREFARQREGHLASVLDQYAHAHLDSIQTGIIGRLKGDRARQPASSTYWGLMRAIGIVGESSGPNDYCRQVSEEKAAKGRRAMMHTDDSLVAERAADLWAAEIPANPTPGFPADSKAFTPGPLE